MKKNISIISLLVVGIFTLGCDDPTTVTSLDEAEDKCSYEDYYTAVDAICFADYKDSAEACMVIMLWTDKDAEPEYAKRVLQRACDLKDPRAGAIEYNEKGVSKILWTPQSCANLYDWLGDEIFKYGDKFNYEFKEGVRLLEERKGIRIPVYITSEELLKAQNKEKAMWD